MYTVQHGYVCVCVSERFFKYYFVRHWVNASTRNYTQPWCILTASTGKKLSRFKEWAKRKQARKKESERKGEQNDNDDDDNDEEEKRLLLNTLFMEIQALVNFIAGTYTHTLKHADNQRIAWWAITIRLIAQYHRFFFLFFSIDQQKKIWKNNDSAPPVCRYQKAMHCTAIVCVSERIHALLQNTSAKVHALHIYTHAHAS